MNITTEIIDINTLKVGDKVRVRNYDYKTGKAVPMLSRDFGFVRSVSEFRGVVVYWPLRGNESCHDIDLVRA